MHKISATEVRQAGFLTLNADFPAMGHQTKINFIKVNT